ncbi:GNAT family N-acetyltransferase [Paenibacillus allorhizosphaerae]|uniref:N-acetyltransferase domain-containing protein n=1 Tax=Paenibacillus allorhizosphaerae TaxID=2849866 RepID=A0ABM8VF57_9BACL|nr:GNAT family N-acetyltransferase [Paenibacillus allorhizosphaerae]CAG7633772.1 hypothetical protein PAECIP111802_01981 [Paenibacillus allorhizosphaerae]
MLDWTAEVPADESFLYELYADVRKIEVQSFGWDEEQVRAFLVMQFEMQNRSYRMQYPGAEHRTIWSAGQRIGRMVTAQLPQAIALVDISLLSAFRNRGIGTELLRSLQQAASDCGKPIQLKVVHRNPAKHLYERLGFRTTQSTDMYDAMQWHPTIH